MTDIKHCAGCSEDFYNGHNQLGVKECWNRKTATMVDRVFIHIDQCPPYKTRRVESVPSCYRRTRFVAAKPDAFSEEGYWK